MVLKCGPLYFFGPPGPPIINLPLTHTMPPSKLPQPQIDTQPTDNVGLISKKMVPFEMIKFEGLRSHGEDDLMGLIFCMPLRLIETFTFPTSSMIPMAPSRSNLQWYSV